MNAPPARHNVAPRSAGAPEALIRQCCLRCSKNLARNPNIRCVKQGNRSVCDRCRSMNKPCHVVSTHLSLASPILILKVPQSCVPRLNRLLRKVDAALATPANSDQRQAAIATVTAQQAAYTSRVEATVRGARVPATIQGMGQAILTSLAQMQTSLDGIVDVLRYQVSVFFPQLCRRLTPSRPTFHQSLAMLRTMMMMMLMVMGVRVRRAQVRIEAGLAQCMIMGSLDASAWFSDGFLQ